MRKLMTVGTAVISSLVLADITPAASISQTAKKVHGCHDKCNKGPETSTPTTQ